MEFISKTKLHRYIDDVKKSNISDKDEILAGLESAVEEMSTTEVTLFGSDTISPAHAILIRYDDEVEEEVHIVDLANYLSNRFSCSTILIPKTIGLDYLLSNKYQEFLLSELERVKRIVEKEPINND